MEQESPRTVLVIGATGNQGGGLIAHLLASKGWRVRGLTRTPSSDKAKALSGRGVEVVQGDLNDVSSLDAAMEGAYGVFSVQSQAPEDDPMLEMRQGIAVVDAARRAGVSHLVYTASCGAKEPDRGVSYWDAKREVVAYVQKSGIPYTVLRPVSFMENYLADRQAIQDGAITGLLTPDKKLQVISGYDIGAFAAAAFNRPDEFIGHEIDVAAETATMNDIAATLGKVVGHLVVYRQRPKQEWDGLPASSLAMNAWYQEHGYDEDIPALLERWRVPVLSFEEWLLTIGWRR